MSYIFDKLKEALGGEKYLSSRTSVIRDWTPNNIRALIIARGYILVLHHVGGFEGAKIVKLDVNLVAQDLESLQRNISSPKLNSILKKRSLSCLEEVYVDSVFAVSNCPIIDIMGYVNDLLSSSSRLRYFGYGEFPLGSEVVIKDLYRQNKSNLNYSLAKDTNCPINLEVRGVENNNWYKNYFLRPKYYKLDEDKGRLALHFRKFENDYEKFIENEKKAQQNNILEEGLRKVVEIDNTNIPYLRKVDNLLLYLAKNPNDAVSSLSLKAVRKVLLSRNVIKGLEKKKVIGVLGNLKEREYLLKSYERYGVLDNSKDSSLDVEEVKKLISNKKGFIDIESTLDGICLEVTSVLLKNGYKDLVSVALLLTEKYIPNGKTRELYIKKKSNNSCAEGYFNYLGELIGVEL